MCEAVDGGNRRGDFGGVCRERFNAVGRVGGLVSKEESMEERYPCSWTFKQRWGKGWVTALKVKADYEDFKSKCDV